jgi:hypothetical protein
MTFRFGDLVLESDFPCPQLPEVAGVPAECAFRVIEGGSGEPPGMWDHAWRGPGGDVTLHCVRDGGVYRLGMPGLATFTIEDDGARVVCTPCGDQPAETLEHLLIDQVLPRVLTHRGRVVLHAGAVAGTAGAIAFLGESGAGKSTLCGSFARSGHRVLGDDGLVVLDDGGAVRVIPTYPGLRLLPPSLRFFYADSVPGVPVAGYTAKRRVAPARPDAEQPLPLRAIYALAAGERIAIEPVDGAPAIVALIRSSFHLHLDDPERSRRLFERLAGIVDAVPVRQLTYPREFSILDEVREAVLADASAVEAA